MTITIYIAPDGTEYRALPRTYGQTTNITEAWALAHGWSKENKEVPDPPEPVKQYSQYRVHQVLENAGIWEAFWNALTPSQKQYWNEAQNLSTDDSNFMAGLSALEAAMNLGEFVLPEGETIESILEEARI